MLFSGKYVHGGVMEETTTDAVRDLEAGVQLLTVPNSHQDAWHDIAPKDRHPMEYTEPHDLDDCLTMKRIVFLMHFVKHNQVRICHQRTTHSHDTTHTEQPNQHIRPLRRAARLRHSSAEGRVALSAQIPRP